MWFVHYFRLCCFIGDTELNALFIITWVILSLELHCIVYHYIAAPSLIIDSKTSAVLLVSPHPLRLTSHCVRATAKWNITLFYWDLGPLTSTNAKCNDE